MTTTAAPTPTLERLVYTSRACESMGTLMLFNLLNQARRKNERLQITGHLLYADGLFTQCLEGPSQSIDGLWKSIQADPRHDAISLLIRVPIETRRFKEWTMAFSSYRYLNEFDMPGFFPINVHGESAQTKMCIS